VKIAMELEGYNGSFPEYCVIDINRVYVRKLLSRALYVKDVDPELNSKHFMDNKVTYYWSLPEDNIFSSDESSKYYILQGALPEDQIVEMNWIEQIASKQGIYWKACIKKNCGIVETGSTLAIDDIKCMLDFIDNDVVYAVRKAMGIDT
jgi:hypothetical protein